MLDIRDLHANAGNRTILKGLTLSIAPGQVHAIMGPNGSGKSTLSHVLAGKPGYEVTGGTVTWQGRDLLSMPAEERAAAGIFLAMQYPVEIPGVTTINFLRAAVNAQARLRGEKEPDAVTFLRRVKEEREKLNMSDEMVKRPVNVGFSGGEKKRNEVLQMAILKPALAILDETDSGLDIDALKVVAGGINALRAPDRSFLMITHYQRLLDYIAPDFVHVLAGGRIVTSGGPELARRLEAEGYDGIVKVA
ncbi:MAG: Fe-S cluster assembly ATPase SufC [Alphaproteobacteria bacterium]